MNNRSVNIDRLKKIGTIIVVVIIAVAIFLLWSDKVKYKDPLDYSGTDITLTTDEVFEYNENGTLRKEVEDRIAAGIAREHENGYVEWIYKPGTLPMNCFEVKNTMNAVVEAAVKIDDSEDEEYVYAGISVGPSPEIKRICRIKVIAGEEDPTTVETNYDKTNTSTSQETTNTDGTKTTTFYITKPSDEPIKTGYIFGGWYYTDANGEEKRFDFDAQVTQGYDLWAKWYREETYGVTYEPQTTTEDVTKTTTRVEREVETSSFSYFSEYNNAEYNVRYDRGAWHGFTKIYFSLLPLLLLLLGLVLYRDLKAIIWYKKKKIEYLESVKGKLKG